MNRRNFCMALASMVPGLYTGAVFSASLKSNPIRLVVPFSPGGNLDTVARAVAPTLAEILGVSVVVENKPGAGGVIGAAEVARAKPDGHTLLVTTPNAVTVAPLMTKTSYSLQDFTAIGSIAWASLVVVVNPQGRFKTMEALLDAARKNPGSVTMGHAGLGTTNNIALLGLEEAAGCQFTAVPYKGSAPALTDLLGNQLDAVIDQLTSSMPNIAAGKLKALAVMTTDRDPFLPDVPTLAEAGIKDFTATTETGLMAPAGTPDDIIQQLNKALNQAAVSEKVKTVLANVGSTAAPSSPAEFQRVLDNQAVNAQALHQKGKLTAAQ